MTEEVSSDNSIVNTEKIFIVFSCELKIFSISVDKTVVKVWKVEFEIAVETLQRVAFPKHLLFILLNFRSCLFDLERRNFLILQRWHFVLFFFMKFYFAINLL